MRYDPVKDIFAKIIKSNLILRKLFYFLLNLFFLRSWYIRKVLKRIIPEIRSSQRRIYDAGTGFAQYTYFIAKKFPETEILAVDIKDDYIHDAREFFKKLNYNHVFFEIEDLTKITHDAVFDLILCVDVMEHIEDDQKVLNNFYSALKRDGYVIINTPSIFGGSDVHNESDESFIGEHFRTGYSKEDLSKKLKNAGFTKIDGFYTYGFWGDRAWRLGIKIPMMLLNIRKLFFIILPFYYLITLPLFLLMNYFDTISKIEKGTGLIVIAKK